jgi:poly-gamma-glutamate synthesis protein (capsule biosynthesis protein)
MSLLFKIVIAGDLLPSRDNISLFEDGDSEQLFGNEICTLFSNADFSIMNLEGALTDSVNKQEKSGPVLKAPKKAINAIKGLGVSAVTLANNHVTDYGHEGYLDTIDTLENAGLQYVGAGINENEIKKYLTIVLGDRKICIYNVSETFFNVACESSAGVNIYDEYVVCKDLQRLKQNHDYIIVIYHGGAEEFPYPTPLVKKRFYRMADNGADFITAQHTHCIGCYERYKNSYLLYGQGNFLFARMKADIARHGLITEIVFYDNAIDIKQHFTSVSDGVVRYDEIQNTTSFDERSKELSNWKSICEKYNYYAYHRKRLKTRSLSALRGDFLFRNFIRKYFNNFYTNKVLERYKKDQLIRAEMYIESDRNSEDLAALFTYMIKKKSIK